MTLQLKDGSLLNVSGQLANDPACCCGGECCDGAYSSIDVDLAISGGGDCCSDADSLFTGVHNVRQTGTCNYGNAISGASATACGSSGLYKIVGLAIYVNLDNGTGTLPPYDSASKIRAAVAIEYQLAGASPGPVHLRVYRFERLSCDVGAMSFIDSYVDVVAGGGSPTFTPAACTVTLDVDALNA